MFLGIFTGEDLELHSPWCKEKDSLDCNLRPEGFADDKQGKGGFYSGLGNGKIAHFNIDRNGDLFVNQVCYFIIIDSIYCILMPAKVLKTSSAEEEGVKCGEPENEFQCGRPLGMEYSKNMNKIIFCDTRGLMGIRIFSFFFFVLTFLEFNLVTRKVTVLTDTDPEGNPIKFCNDVALTQDEQYLYFTGMSLFFHFIYLLLFIINFLHS